MNPFGTLLDTVFFNILLTIDAFLYSGFSKLYTIYLTIANMIILTDDLYKDVTNRIYVVVGVLALFMIAYSILQTIIDPDSKKGANGISILKRVVTAFTAVFLVPISFQFLYGLQNAVLSGNVISNIVNGRSASVETTVPVKFVDEEDGQLYYVCDSCIDETNTSSCKKILASSVSDYKATGACAGDNVMVMDLDEIDIEIGVQSQVGNYMAVSILEGFMSVQPGIDPDSVNPELADYYLGGAGGASVIGCAGGAIVVGGAALSGFFTGGTTWTTIWPALMWTAGACAVTGAVAGGGTLVASFVSSLNNGVYEILTDKNYTWSQVITNIIVDGEFQYIIPFSTNIGDEIIYYPVLSTLAIAFSVYLMLNFVIDVAVRVFKLAFYQIIAPIPIFLSILPSNEKLLQNWIKIILTVYFEVFIRVLIISFMPFFVYALSSIDAVGGNVFLKSIMTIGAITFCKQAPKYVSEVTGIKSDGIKLGLRDKLAEGGVFAAGSLGYAGITQGIRNYQKGPKFDENASKRTNVLNSVKRAGTTIAGINAGVMHTAKNGGMKARNVSEAGAAANKGMSVAKYKKVTKDAKNQARQIEGTSKSPFVNHVAGIGKDLVIGASKWTDTYESVEKLKAEQQIMAHFISTMKGIKDAGKSCVLEDEIMSSHDLAGAIFGDSFKSGFHKNFQESIDYEKILEKGFDNFELHPAQKDSSGRVIPGQEQHIIVANADGTTRKITNKESFIEHQKQYKEDLKELTDQMEKAITGHVTGEKMINEIKDNEEKYKKTTKLQTDLVEQVKDLSSHMKRNTETIGTTQADMNNSNLNYNDMKKYLDGFKYQDSNGNDVEVYSVEKASLLTANKIKEKEREIENRKPPEIK
ncbi:MAG: hypothetical protein R3Y13_04880 [bacterium]